MSTAPTLENTSVNPTNNIYWVPVGELSQMQCLDGKSMIGIKETYTLVEGSSPIDAMTRLTEYPGFHLNYNKLTEEQKQRISAFKLRPGKIEPVLFCKHRFKNRDGDYTCGQPLYDLPNEPSSDDPSVNMNGLYGMCVLENYDTPEGLNCPYKNRGIYPEDR